MRSDELLAGHAVADRSMQVYARLDTLGRVLYRYSTAQTFIRYDQVHHIGDFASNEEARADLKARLIAMERDGSENNSIEVPSPIGEDINNNEDLEEQPQ